MKIRNGFISNSSSASFIVLLDKKPDTIEEIVDSLRLVNYKKKEVKKIFDRAQICDGHVRTVKELNLTNIRNEWETPDDLRLLSHESYVLGSLGTDIVEMIQKRIDERFHYPEHPYKVLIDMDDQIYGLNIADSYDESRFIPFVNETTSDVFEDENESFPRQTVKEFREELERSLEEEEEDEN